MKYRLLKDLPWITAWAEFIEHEETETFSRIAFSHVPCVWPEFAKDNPDFFEPIVEKTTFDDLSYGDTVWYLSDDWSACNTIFNAYNSYTRSETFLTREEAEDEHKRREWACRKDKFIPKIGDEYWGYSTYSEKPVWDYYWRGGNDTILSINLWLVFRTKEECKNAIDNHGIIRLFYTTR